MAKIQNTNRVIVQFAGIPILSGKADDEWCAVAPVSDAYEDSAGADGEVTRTATNDPRHVATITLKQTSVVNGLLSALHNIDLASDGGGGVGPFSVTDLNGTEVFLAERAWIKRAPDHTHGKTVKDRAWIIMCVASVKYTGGQA